MWRLDPDRLGHAVTCSGVSDIFRCVLRYNACVAGVAAIVKAGPNVTDLRYLLHQHVLNVPFGNLALHEMPGEDVPAIPRWHLKPTLEVRRDNVPSCNHPQL